MGVGGRGSSTHPSSPASTCGDRGCPRRGSVSSCRRLAYANAALGPTASGGAGRGSPSTRGRAIYPRSRKHTRFGGRWSSDQSQPGVRSRHTHTPQSQARSRPAARRRVGVDLDRRDRVVCRQRAAADARRRGVPTSVPFRARGALVSIRRRCGIDRFRGDCSWRRLSRRDAPLGSHPRVRRSHPRSRPTLRITRAAQRPARPGEQVAASPAVICPLSQSPDAHSTLTVRTVNVLHPDAANGVRTPTMVRLTCVPSTTTLQGSSVAKLGGQRYDNHGR